MTDKWYKTGGYRDKQITPVDVIRETAKQVVVLSNWMGKPRERRNNKSSNYENYFKTYQEAYDFVINRRFRRIEGLQESLRREKEGLDRFVRDFKQTP